MTADDFSQQSSASAAPPRKIFSLAKVELHVSVADTIYSTGLRIGAPSPSESLSERREPRPASP